MFFVVLWCPRPSLDSGRNIFHRVLAPSFLHLNMLCIFVSVIIVSVSFCTPLRFRGVLSVPSPWPSSPSRCPSPWPSPSSSPSMTMPMTMSMIIAAPLWCPVRGFSCLLILVHHASCSTVALVLCAWVFFSFYDDVDDDGDEFHRCLRVYNWADAMWRHVRLRGLLLLLLLLWRCRWRCRWLWRLRCDILFVAFRVYWFWFITVLLLHRRSCVLCMGSSSPSMTTPMTMSMNLAAPLCRLLRDFSWLFRYDLCQTAPN